MKVVSPLQDHLLGRRVRRVPPYQQRERSNDGVIVGFFSADARGRTHVTVRFDDGQVKNCHPSALRVEAARPTPPAFQTVEQAEAWMAKQLRTRGSSPYVPKVR